MTINLNAQHVPSKGVPYLDNYMPEHFKDAGKIWDIESNDQNLLFLASDNGLLEFDGINWKKYKGSKGFTRSLYVANDSLLYTGSDLDFGKWELNENLNYEYTSVYPFKENIGQTTEEFWGVYEVNSLIIFISFNNIYVYNNDQLTKIPAPYRFSGSYFVGDKLYISDENNGIYSFDGISLNLEIKYPENKPLRIVGLSNVGNELLIVTQNQGLFKESNGELKEWSITLSDMLSKDQAFSFTNINDEYYVFGTILNGIYITDINGEIVQNINKQKGMLNNTILDLYYSPNGVLWASMDLGLCGIQLSQDLSYVFDHAGNFGTGQTALIQNDIFYLGSNQGLYTKPWNNFAYQIQEAPFQLVPNSAGQVWDLESVSNDILCGHDKGLYLVSKGQFVSINKQIGVLDILPIDKDKIFVGTYNGIHLYRRIRGEWRFVHELDLIKGACNQIEIDENNNLWVLIPNYGLLIAELSADFNIKSREIFQIENFIGDVQSLKTNGGIKLITEKREYTYDLSGKKMKESKKTFQPKIVKHRLPRNFRSKVLNDSVHFTPIYNGFSLSHQQNISNNLNNDTILLRKLKVFNIDTSFLHPFRKEIPYLYNNLKVQFIIPQKEHVEYRYYLERIMEKWSNWSSKTEFQLLNLREGDHTLKIEGRIGNGKICKTEVTFSIQTPWYLSVFAYISYFIIFGLFIYALRRWQNYKLEEQRQRLLYKEQVSLKLQAEEYNKEAFVQKQKELEIEKDALKKELRTTKINLVIKAKEDDDKKRMIHSIVEKLQSMQGNDFSNRMKWKELFRIIEGHQEKENKTFQIQMDELNQAFIQNLKSNYPSLTMYDLRLCTYIKTGLSTREIAEMMHVLPSSINVSRSRLRKKLNLKAKDDLYSFLEGIQ